MPVKQFIQYLRELPPWVKNKYFITGALFAIWMMFFDANSFLARYQYRQELGELRQKQEWYIAEIKQVQQDKEDLFSSAESIEKYARENYWMKKDNEDIFIIIEE